MNIWRIVNNVKYAKNKYEVYILKWILVTYELRMKFINFELRKR